MSKLTELLDELCPDGVEYRVLGDLTELSIGKFVKKTKQRDDFEYPVYNGGAEPTGYFSEWNAEADSIVIAARGSIGFVNFVTTKFWAGNSSYVLKNLGESIDRRYLYHYLKHHEHDLYKLRSTGSIPAINKKPLSQMLIGIPPLEVQQEIVRVLDAFTNLEQSLVSELELRKKQLDHYRSQVLSADSSDSDLVELGELGRIVTGRTPKGDDPNAWGSEVNFVTPSDIGDGVKMVSSTNRQLSAAGAQSLMKSFVPAGSILVTCIGVVGKTVINDHDCVTNQQINSIILNPSVNADYVFHALTALRPQLSALGSRSTGTMPILNKTNFSRIKISLPSITRQNEIAETLNKFDALISASGSGIQAEIDLRRQQYEFYRDELLNFVPKED